MIGNRVTVRLQHPDETISGELRRQNSEGVWIYHGFAEQAKVYFYPMHRIVQVEDDGPLYR